MKPRRVIVTGGATNIGRAITEGFLAQGARVVVGQPDPAVAAPLLEQYGDRVVALPVDIGSAAACRAFVDEAAAALGGLDVLVNNAALTGASVITRLEDLQEPEVDRLLRVNIGGVLFCSQAAVPHLRQAGGGVLVQISSVNAFRPQRGALVYAASKAAVGSLTQSLAKELAKDGIRVVAVAPGDIRTDGRGQVAEELAARGVASDVIAQTPLGIGSPPDVAATVVFLCSEQARFVTGVTWVVDGGWLA